MVTRLADALAQAGLEVWWDEKLSIQDRFRDRILSEIESAKCVIVLWSRASTGPEADFVRDEAGRAKKLGTLFQIRIDDVALPLGFGEQQALDLIGWNGNRSDPRFLYLLKAAEARVRGLPIGPPPISRKVRRVASISLSSLGVVIAALVIARFPVLTVTCKLAFLGRVCGEMGVSGFPSPEEEALWERRTAGSCESLRSFLNRFPHAAYAAEAQARLAAARSERKESWTSEEKRLPLVVRTATDSFPSEEVAHADALKRAPNEAADQCVGFSQGEFRLRSARAIPTQWHCMRRMGGYACGFDGIAICAVEVRRIVRTEICP